MSRLGVGEMHCCLKKNRTGMQKPYDIFMKQGHIRLTMPTVTGLNCESPSILCERIEVGSTDKKH
jgi:hypothetical protein